MVFAWHLALDARVSLLIASDHGNIEDVARGHTRNPALGVLAGPAATKLAGRLGRIEDVAPTLLEHLGVGDPDPD